MADSRVFIILIMVFFIYVESTFRSGKGLFCRDPDTGKLHRVNTTWSSTSFCGNYTCKQRRLNSTEKHYSQIMREFHIPNITFNKTEKSKTIEPKLESNSKQRIAEPNELNSDSNPNTDRYLTEDEIKTISEMLHTVKKSDIDAIVDIYNLAQEIYNEMDKVTDQSAIDEAVNNVKDKLGEINHEHLKPSTYWYDWKTRTEMDSKVSPSHHNVIDTPTITSPTTSKQNNDKPSYFNGPLNKKDFGKIPYYYPISSFQRTATYVHKPIQPNKAVEKPPCNKQKAAQKPPVNVKDSVRLIKPSYLLPYPFSYVHNQNVSKHQNMYYSNPWVWDYYYRNRQTNPYFKAYIAQIPNAVLINPHLSDPAYNVEIMSVDRRKKNVDMMFEKDAKRDWKTDSLSNKVLNEVKAYMDTTQFIKAFPLRKKVKVERIGKLIKVDENTRYRRQAEEDAIAKGREFEAFIERVTCEQRTEPGYFRYGNLTQPYPHCCPQLIMNS